MDTKWPTLIVMILAVPLSAGTTCPKYCVCSHFRMVCDGKGGFLHKIPRPPAKVKTVKLKNINLDHLTKEMIVNLTHCKLEVLSLIATNITNVADDVFRDLRYLETLNLAQSHISISAIGHCIKSIRSNLIDFFVEADSTDGDSMNATLFEKLTHLRHLTVSLTNLKVFNATALSHLTELVNLKLPNNRLKHIIMGCILHNVTYLNLYGNNFDDFPQICRPDSTPYMPRLQTLDVGNNAIRDLNVSRLTCLCNLTKLVLSENRIEIIRDNTFVNLPNLTNLHMSNLPLKKIHDLAFNSSSLYQLMFQQHQKLLPRQFNPDTLFKSTPHLGILDLTKTKMYITSRLLAKLLLNLKNIERLVLTQTRIKTLPSGVFSKLTKLRTLILSGNTFSYWQSGVFKNVTSIKKISFESCKIKIIKENSFPLEFRLALKEINLAENPFTCTCDLLWFKNWIREVRANKSITFTSYPENYECRAPNIRHMKLQDFNPTAESCSVNEMYTLILTAAFGFCIALIMIGLVAYRYRWYMLYWVSLLRRRRQRHQRQNLLREMKYDAFVSYSNSDNDWIYDELLKYLEGELGLRLCEHSRDFEAGKLIVDNVFDAMDTSGKTILVISNVYMQSDWCQFELQMALNSFYKHEADLVVILLEPIQARHVTSTLRALMTSTTYIEWSEDLEAKALFMERLKNSLKN